MYLGIWVEGGWSFLEKLEITIVVISVIAVVGAMIFCNYVSKKANKK